MLAHKSIPITDRSSIGEARRSALVAAQLLGMAEDVRSNVGIAATEAANNVLLHGGGGELLICPMQADGGNWLDLIALDSGPGIRDVTRAMEDGFSTGGTAGQGLGAIQRVSHASSLMSAQGKGTAYWVRFVSGHLPPQARVGIVCIPIKGETVAGDSFLITAADGRTVYMMVDGLGHGVGAAEAASEAVATVTRYAGNTATEILLHTHDALKKTRGAALFLALMNPERTALTCAGIGNISATLVTGSTSKSLVSQNGTLGAILPRQPQEYTVAVERNSMLVMFSDGLNSKTSLTGYPGILMRPPALIASLLYRDFSRRRDDASVMVAPLGADNR